MTRQSDSVAAVLDVLAIMGRDILTLLVGAGHCVGGRFSPRRFTVSFPGRARSSVG
jgi:hypothetical protein